MPKITKKLDRWEKLRETIQGRRTVLRLSYKDLGDKIGTSKSTVNRWCNEPSTMSLADYIDLMAALDFTADEARALIPMR